MKQTSAFNIKKPFSQKPQASIAFINGTLIRSDGGCCFDHSQMPPHPRNQKTNNKQQQQKNDNALKTRKKVTIFLTKCCCVVVYAGNVHPVLAGTDGASDEQASNPVFTILLYI